MKFCTNHDEIQISANDHQSVSRSTSLCYPDNMFLVFLVFYDKKLYATLHYFFLLHFMSYISHCWQNSSMPVTLWQM